MGWAIVTHPFHPLRGQRFRIVQSRVWAGRAKLILEGGDCGTFSVWREWTDRDPANGGSDHQGGPVLAQAALLELAALLAAWRDARKKD